MDLTKRMLLLSATICLFLIGHAQEFENFGKITEEDRQIKSCEFDKDATAIILLEEAKSNYNDDHNLITDYHIRIKILKDKGIGEGSISIRFYRKDDFENISNIEAITYNPDENGLYYQAGKVESKSRYKQDVNERMGEIKFAFPSVKIGSILEYRYRSIMKHYGGLRDWYFQKELPVMHSYYKLYIIPNAEFTYRVTKLTEYPIVIKPDEINGAIYFEMNKIPGLREEPFMDARETYLQKVIFQLSAYNNGYGKSKYMTSWDEVDRVLRGDYSFGGQLGKSIPGTDDIIQKAKLITSLPDRMQFIYEYVRGNMNWNGLYGKYAMDGVKSAWSKKNGSSGEINLILINLLKAADLETNPILVCERFFGKLVTAYPFVDQFNSVYAAVDINDKRYFLDATDKFSPARIIPYDILNTTGLLLTKKKAILTEIKNDSLRFEDNYNVSFDVSSEGSVKAVMNERCKDYAKIYYKKQYYKNKDTYVDEHFRDLLQGVNIEDFKWKNADNDSLPLSQGCNFNFNIQGSGDYKFIPLNLLPQFKSNPFLAENRFTDIDFGYKQSIALNLKVQLPENYTVDALPKSVRMTNPSGDIEFVRKMFYEKESNQVACMIDLNIKKGIFPSTAYSELKEFYKNMFNFLDEQVAIKKK